MTADSCDENVNYIVIKDNFFLNKQAQSILINAYSKYTKTTASKAISDYYGRPVKRNYKNVTESASLYLSYNAIMALALIFFLF
jgi:hypothetical protein